MSIVGSSKKSLHNDQPIYGGIIVTYRSYSIRRRGERTEEEEQEEKRRRRRRKRRSLPLRLKRRMPLRFDQIQEGPQDPFCANAQGNVEEDHGTTKKRRIHRNRATDRERTSRRSRTDDRNVFCLRYRGTRGGKKRRNPARARIYRVTLSELFQYRPKAELVLSSSFPSRSFIKSCRATAAVLVFFLVSTQVFFFFFFFF